MAALQRIAGYSSIQITARYYPHVSPETHADTIRVPEALDNMPPGVGRGASKMRVDPAGELKSAVSI
jgi:hypothetical protein